MAFKLVVIASVLAYANAGLLGAPAVATYSAAPAVSTSYIHQAPLAVAPAGHVISSYAAPSVAIHAPTYGSSHQSVERSLGGAQSISHYSKAIDSAFSSVRKYDTRITNDGLTLAHAPVASYAAPVVAKAVAPVAYSAAPVAYSAAPAVAYSSAPAVSSAYLHNAQQYVAKAVAPVAPVATYAAPAQFITKSHAAPVQQYAYSAPVQQYAYSAPVVAKAVAPVAAPLHVSAPVVAKAAVAYSPATVVAHTTFTGLGTAYQW